MDGRDLIENLKVEAGGMTRISRIAGKAGFFNRSPGEYVTSKDVILMIEPDQLSSVVIKILTTGGRHEGHHFRMESFKLVSSGDFPELLY